MYSSHAQRLSRSVLADDASLRQSKLASRATLDVMPSPSAPYSEQDMERIEEILRYAEAGWRAELRFTPDTKFTLLRVLQSYKEVLQSHGLEPSNDTDYYRLLLKMSLMEEPDWWKKYDYVQKVNAKQRTAWEFRRKRLMHAAFSPWKRQAVPTTGLKQPPNSHLSPPHPSHTTMSMRDLHPRDSMTPERDALEEAYAKARQDVQLARWEDEAKAQALAMEEESKSYRPRRRQRRLPGWSESVPLAQGYALPPAHQARALTQRATMALGVPVRDAPWKKKKRRRLTLGDARAYHQWKMQAKHFRQWRRLVLLVKFHRDRAVENWMRALTFWETRWYHKCMGAFRRAHAEMVERELRAQRFRDRHILHRGFWGLAGGIRAKQEEEDHLQKATRHWRHGTLGRCFTRLLEAARAEHVEPFAHPTAAYAAFRWWTVSHQVVLPTDKYANVDCNDALVAQLKPSRRRWLQKSSTQANICSLRSAFRAWRMRSIIVHKFLLGKKQVTLRSCLLGWRDAAYMGKQLRERIAVFDDMLSKSLMETVMSRWRSALRMRLRMKRAIEHCDLVRKADAWEIWAHQTQVWRRQRELMIKAMDHCDQVRVEQAFHRWAEWTQDCVEAHQRQDTANEFWVKTAAARCFGKWRKAYERRLREKTADALAGDFLAHRRKEQCLAKWKAYTEYRRNKEMQRAAALLHRRSFLTSYVWSVWRQRIEGWKIKRERCETAHNVWEVATMRKVMTTWRREMRFREAGRYFYGASLSRAWEHWRQYTSYRRHVGMLKASADEFHEEHLMAQSWDTWKQAVHQQRRFQDISAMIARNHSEGLQHLTFSAWRSYARECGKQHDLFWERWDRGLLRRYLQRWHQRARHFGKVRSLFQDLLGHKNVKREKDAWIAWKDAYAQRLRMKKATLHFTRSTEARAFWTWRQHVREQKEDRKRMQKSVTYFVHREQLRAFRQWREWTREQQWEHQQMHRAAMAWTRRTELHIFAQWVEFTQQSKDEKRALRHAVQKLRQGMLSRSFVAWHEWAKEEQHTKQLLAPFVRRMNQQHLVMAWEEWVGFVEQAKRERALLASAAQRMSQLKVHAAWNTWIGFVETEKRNRELVKQALGTILDMRRAAAFRSWRAWALHRSHNRKVVGAHLARMQQVALYRSLVAWHAWAVHERDLKAAHAVVLQRRTRRYFDQWVRERDGQRIARNALLRIKQRDVAMAWSRWREFMVEKRAAEKVMHNALVWWSRRQEASAFQQWREFVEIVQHERDTTQRAAMFWKNHAVMRVWVQWVEYVKEEQTTRAKLERASALWQHRTAATAVRTWKIWVWEQQEEREKMDKALVFWQQRSVVKAWATWEHVVSTKKHLRSLMQRVVFHRQARAWATWRENVAHMRRLRGVVHRWEMITVRSALDQWIDWVDEKRAIEQRAEEQLHRAVALWSHGVLSRCFRQLKDNAVVCRRVRAILGRVQQRHLATAWNSWLAFVDRQKWERRVMTRLSEQQDQRRVEEAFHVWRGMYIRLHKERHLRQRVIQRMQRAAESRAFSAWLAYSQRQKAAKSMMYRALAKDAHQRFIRWVVFVQRCQQERRAAHQVVLRRENRCMRDAFVQWRLRHRLSSRIARLLTRVEGREVQHAWDAWCAYHDHQVEKREAQLAWKERRRGLSANVQGVVDDAVRRWKLAPLGKAMETWKRFAQDRSQARLFNTLAVDHRYRWVTSSVLRSWLVVTVEERQLRTAVQFWSGRTTHTVMDQWKQFVCDQKHVRKLHDRAVRFWTKHALADVFDRWRANVEAAHRREEQANLALAMRLGELSSRVLQGWRQAAMMKKEHRRMKQVADLACEHLLMSRSMGKWVDAVEAQRLRRYKVQQGLLRLQQLRMKKAFDAWSAQAQLQATTRRALATLTGRVTKEDLRLRFHRWHSWAARRAWRRQQLEHYMFGVIPERRCRAVLEAWREYASARAHYHRQTARALSFMRQRKERMVFDAWWEWSSIRVRHRRVVAHHLQTHLMPRAFRTWKDNAMEQRAERTNLNKAVRMWTHRSMGTALRTWQLHASEQRRHREIVDRCVRKMSKRHLSMAFDAWWEWAADRQRLRKAANKLMIINNERQMAGRWDHWRGLFETKRRHRRLLSEAAHRMGMLSLQHAFEEWKTLVQVRHKAMRVVAKRWMCQREAAVFARWKEFAAERKERRVAIQSAVAHAMITNVRRSMAIWKGYVAYRRHCRKQQEQAIQFLNVHRLQYGFSEWRGYFLDRTKKHMDLAKAVQMWTLHKERAAWTTWFEWAKEQRQFRKASSVFRMREERKAWSKWTSFVRERKLARAVLWHDGRLTDSYFHRWIEYVDQRKIKAQRQTIAVQYNVDRLTQHAWDVWNDAMQRRAFLRQAGEQLLMNTHLGVEQRCFSQWHTAFLASRHCRRKQLRKHWSMWMSYHARKSAKRQRLAGVLVRMSLGTERRAFVAWRTHIQGELAERARLLREHEVADRLEGHLQRVRLRSLHTVFVTLREEARVMQVLKERALVLWKNTLLTKALSSWMAYREYRIERRKLLSRAVMHHDTMLCLRVVQTWRLNAQAEAKEREQQTVALVHFRYHEKAKAFRSWVDYVDRMRRAHNLAFRALGERNAVRLRLWHEWAHHRTRVRVMGDIVRSGRLEYLVRHMFDHWRQSMERGVHERAQVNLVEEWRARRVATVHLHAWRAIAQVLSARRARLSAGEAAVMDGRLRRLWNQWRRAFQQHQADRLVREREMMLCKRVLLYWHHECLVARKQEESQRTMKQDVWDRWRTEVVGARAQQQLMDIKARWILDKWAQATHQLQRAREMGQRHRMRRCLVAWRAYSAHRHMSDALTRIADHYYHRTVLSRWFLAWRSLHHTEMFEQARQEAYAERVVRRRRLGRAFRLLRAAEAKGRRRRHRLAADAEYFRKRRTERAALRALRAWRAHAQQVHRIHAFRHKWRSVRGAQALTAWAEVAKEGAKYRRHAHAAHGYFVRRLMHKTFFQWRLVARASNWESHSAQPPPRQERSLQWNDLVGPKARVDVESSEEETGVGIREKRRRERVRKMLMDDSD